MTGSDEVSSRSSFQLHVLPLQWPHLGGGYTVPEVWPQLLAADLGQAVFVLDGSDIGAYDWEHQEIWLTQEAIARVVRTGADRLLRDMIGRAFVITLAGQRLYGGLFYYEGGAAGIRFPVIHALGEPIAVLRIRPALGHGWWPTEPYLAPQCQAIANPVLADWLDRQRLIQSFSRDRRPPDHFVRDA